MPNVRVYNRLSNFPALKKNKKLIAGVIGCMAEGAGRANRSHGVNLGMTDAYLDLPIWWQVLKRHVCYYIELS